MDFKQWLLERVDPDRIEIPPDQVSTDYQKEWYHGALGSRAVRGILSSGRLATRAEGARATNAAAMGLGIYLTDDVEESQAYAGGGVQSAVFKVRIVSQPKLLRLTNSPQDNQLFEQIRSIGLQQPDDVNQLPAKHGYTGIHWDLTDRTEKLAIYDSSDLSPAVMAHEYEPTPGTVDGEWQRRG